MSRLTELIRNGIFVAGLVVLLYGVHEWWPPLAKMVGGLSVMGIAYLWEVLTNDSKHPRSRG